MTKIMDWWQAWRRRRYWTAERQLEHLTLMVQADHRWLAHDKIADALTTRYLAALAPNWMSRHHADPCHFRREIGLEPMENLATGVVNARAQVAIAEAQAAPITADEVRAIVREELRTALAELGGKA